MKTSFLTLNEVVTFKGGGTPSRKIPEYWDGDISWATVKDFKRTELSSTQESISPEGLRNSAANLIPSGHVIIPTRMALGKAAINTIDLAINQDLKALIPKREVHNRYLLYAILNLSNNIERLGSGATVKGVTIEQLNSLQILFPPFDDQIRIATLLSRVEALIATRKENLRLLDEFLKSTFLEMFGILNGSFKAWNIKKLMQYTDIVSGVTKGKKYKSETLVEVPYMRVANVQDGFLDLNDIKTIAVTHDELEKFRLIKGDVLLTEGGDPDKLGRGALWENQIEVCIHQNHIFRVRVIDLEELNPSYLSALVGSIYGKSYFLKAAKQTTGIASINSTQLKNFPLIIAPIDLQYKYAEIATKTECLKILYRQSLAELENLYGALSEKAFKGELDLSRIPLEQELEPQMDVNGSESEQEKPSFALLDKGAMSDPAERERLMRRIAEEYFRERPSRTLSFKDFWSRVEFNVLDHMDDEYPPLGVEDYNKIKQWLFERLKSGQVEQHFNTSENQLELRTKP